MDRRKKGSGQITYVSGRKSPWRACVVDSTGKQKSRFFKTEKEAKAFLREVNADANKLKSLLETGVSLRAFSEIFLQEKAKENMKPTAYKTLELNIGRVCDKLGHVMLRDIDSDMVQQLVFDLAKGGVLQERYGEVQDCHWQYAEDGCSQALSGYGSCAKYYHTQC